VQNLGGLYGSGRSPSLVRTDLRTKCSAGKIWQSSSAASRSSKSLVLRAATATNQNIGGSNLSGGLFYAGKSDINGLQASSLIRFCYVSDIVPSEGDGSVGICDGFATQSNRKYPRVLHPPHGSNAALGMSASGSMSEHDPEGYPDSRSSYQPKNGNAGDGRRGSNQQETSNSHTQGPENYANVHKSTPTVRSAKSSSRSTSPAWHNSGSKRAIGLPIFGRQLLNRSSQHSVYSIHSPTYKRTKKDPSHNYAINLPFIGVMVSPHDSSYVLGSEKRPRCRSEALIKPSLTLQEG
jgi:hypothetical protein